jgi:hypothetical protein
VAAVEEAVAVQAAVEAVGEAVAVAVVQAELRQLLSVPAPVRAAAGAGYEDGGFHLLLRGRQNQYPEPKRRPGKGRQYGCWRQRSVRLW